MCIMHLHLHDMLPNVVLSPAQLEGSLFIWKKKSCSHKFCFEGDLFWRDGEVVW